MPRSVLRVGDPRGDAAVGEAEGVLQAVGLEAERGLEGKRPGAVLVGAGGLLDEGLDRLDREARGDLAGDVAAHAVGDDEQAEVRTGAVAVLVARSPEAGMRADGPREGKRPGHDGGRQPRLAASRIFLMEPRVIWATCRRAIALIERDARALEVDVRLGLGQPLLGALARGLGAIDVDLLGALGDLARGWSRGRAAPRRSRTRSRGRSSPGRCGTTVSPTESVASSGVCPGSTPK